MNIKILFQWMVRGYQVVLGPWLGGRCRFSPSCSVYAQEALEHSSWPRALWVITKRVMRCHPWGGAGFDPLPDGNRR